jgi:hypothetical protein
MQTKSVGGIVREQAAARMRAKVLDKSARAIRVARWFDSIQPVGQAFASNCAGVGRTREYSSFNLFLNPRSSDGKVIPLRRGIPLSQAVRSQVYQVAICNWRCWFCYVDEEHLSADTTCSEVLTVSSMLDLYLALPDPPPAIDLSGGEVGLVPEWPLWMNEELDNRVGDSSVKLWSDDNLSHSPLDFLSRDQVDYLAQSHRYSRAVCLKGFDESSFSFNTGLNAKLYTRQLELLRLSLELGFDTYVYAIFAAPADLITWNAVSKFVNRLMRIHPQLPLRVIPLRIANFRSGSEQWSSTQENAITSQHIAGDLWQSAISDQFRTSDLELPYEDVDLS